MIPELEFDATNVGRIFVQNELILDYGAFPDIPIRYSKRQYDGLHAMHLSEPVWDPQMLDSQLKRQREGIRNALLLPLCEEYLTLLRQLQVFAEDAARGRWLARQTTKAPTSDWQTADLLAEVTAACGEGRRKGKQWWFSCAFHEDVTPSFEVDPARKLWHCFSCGEAGGVLDFRRKIGK